MKRIGGAVKPDNVKDGFTTMLTLNLLTSLLDDPFLVLTGSTFTGPGSLAQLDKQFNRTVNGQRRVHVMFQKKHWFDSVVTIRYLMDLRRKCGRCCWCCRCCRCCRCVSASACPSRSSHAPRTLPCARTPLQAATQAKK